jgi:hypothetical protein
MKVKCNATECKFWQGDVDPTNLYRSFCILKELEIWQGIGGKGEYLQPICFLFERM